eukprot:74938_1
MATCQDSFILFFQKFNAVRKLTLSLRPYLNNTPPKSLYIGSSYPKFIQNDSICATIHTGNNTSNISRQYPADSRLSSFIKGASRLNNKSDTSAPLIEDILFNFSILDARDSH